MALGKLLNSTFVKSIEGDLFLAYHGVISQDLIVGLGEALKSDMAPNHPFSFVNRVFAIFIELIQNVMHYSFKQQVIDDRSWGVGAILVYRSVDSYNIVTANAITPKQKELLKEKFVFVNSLNESQLKELYLSRRKQKHNELQSKGAGLGFIDLLRKSGNPLDFSFESVERNSNYLFMNIKIYHEQKATVKV